MGRESKEFSVSVFTIVGSRFLLKSSHEIIGKDYTKKSPPSRAGSFTDISIFWESLTCHDQIGMQKKVDII